jgi:hypothetical protein
MKRVILIIIFFSISLSYFSQANEKIKYRKLTYNYFITKHSTNDTSEAVIEIFFDKKDNAALGQMSFLPITIAIYLISPQISAGLTIISFPLFLNGSYMLIKYRNKKLYDVLNEYKETQKLPKWLRKKTNRLLNYYEEVKTEY